MSDLLEYRDSHVQPVQTAAHANQIDFSAADHDSGINFEQPCPHVSMLVLLTLRERRLLISMLKTRDNQLDRKERYDLLMQEMHAENVALWIQDGDIR